MPNDFDEPIVSWDCWLRDESLSKRIKKRHTVRRDDEALESEELQSFTPDSIIDLEEMQWKRIILIR